MASILGESSSFTASTGDAVDITARVDRRVCTTTEPLVGSCHAAVGTGGGFFVTLEANPERATEYTAIVRCGLDPAGAVAASAPGSTPAITDLELAAYGDVFGLNLRTRNESEGILVYQPEGKTCPVIWGLGPLSPTQLFLGGEDEPIQFTTADGAVTCAAADGAGGLTISAATAGDC